MVDGEECELEPVRDPGLVEDSAHVVFDHLFGVSQLVGDVLVLVSLDEERHDFKLFTGEAIARLFAECVGLCVAGVAGGRGLDVPLT